MLGGATSRCPCGRPREECTCVEADRSRYARRLSGPLLDRIDLVCQLEPLPPLEPVGGEPARDSPAVASRVAAARARQRQRLAGTEASCNAAMDARLTRRYVRLDPPLRRRLAGDPGQAGLSARGHDRVLRLARTIADLDGRDVVRASDIEEALGFRLTGLREAAA